MENSSTLISEEIENVEETTEETTEETEGTETVNETEESTTEQPQGKFYTDEEFNQRGIQTRKIKYHTKPIIQYNLNNEFIREWNSAAEASRYLGVSQSAIGYNLKNKTKTCCGYIFKYKENNND